MNSGVVFRQARDAGPEDDPLRQLQLACVVRLGGCTQSRDAGIPTADEISRYNAECRSLRPYTGPDLWPSEDECRNPPVEPLTLAEKLLIAAFVATAAVAVVAGGAVIIVAAAEIAVPVIISAASSAAAAGTAGAAFYYANAIAVNEIGLFAAGIILSCDGDVVGLARAIAEDPVQALPILAEGFMLKTTISINNGPRRRAAIPVSILPPEEQTMPGQVLVRTRGLPVFEEPERALARPIGPPAPQPEQAPPIGPPGPPKDESAQQSPRRTQTDASRQHRPGPHTGSNFTPEQARILADARAAEKPKGKAIVGVLILPNGERKVLQSGGGQGFSSHVEGKATRFMRDRGIARATLLVESEPCQICDRSTYPHGEVPREGVPSTKSGKPLPMQTPKINTALPRDVVLVVIGPLSTGIYSGTAAP